MENTIKNLLAERGIHLVAHLPLSECHVQKPYLLQRAGIENGTAFLFAVPYYTTNCDDPASNISAYAVSRDYHLFFKQLFDEVLPLLQKCFPENRFAGFTDHSPIAEVEAAVRAGLGFFGKNHLFLTKEHSSFVFLGEIITDKLFSAIPVTSQSCDGCNACLSACPVGLDISKCVSALTQKKGELSAEERAQLLAHKCAWGCDICQRACPITKRARANGTLYTSIPFFQNSALTPLTASALRAMSDEEFSTRAYSWRGRDTILRNLEILEKGEP